MNKMTITLTYILLLFCISACTLQRAVTPSGAISDTVATKVVLTLAAFTQAAQPTALASSTLEQPTNTQSIALTPTPTPTVTLTATMTLALEPSITPIPKPGTIAGDISGYPYGSLPRLSIVAFGQEPPYNYSYLITTAGDTSYLMSSSYLLPGRFQVVAYDAANHTGGCTVIVTVISDQTVTCNITNWGAGYPARPSGVPKP